MKKEILRVEHLTKTFTGIRILDNLSFSLYESEILGLTGLNHSGKTTLANILNGASRPNDGTIWFHGKKVIIPSTKAARSLGIYCIGRQADLILDQTVSENLSLLPEQSINGIFINKKENLVKTQRLLHKMGLCIDAKVRCGSLSPAQQHFVQIAKGVLFHSRIIVIDGITSSYSAPELEAFFSLLRRVQEQNISVIFITQKYAQLFPISSRILVLRKGYAAGTVFPEDYTAEALSALMSGQPHTTSFSHRPFRSKEEVFRIEHVYTPSLHDINLSLAKGEILGINAMNDSDTPSIMRIFTNDEPVLSGSVFLHGKELKNLSPNKLAENRIGVISFSLMRFNLFPNLTVLENLNLLRLKRLKNAAGFISSRIERYTALEFSDTLSFPEKHLYTKVRDLRLSPEQEIMILLERWRSVSPHVLLLSGISRDLDAVSLEQIWSKLESLSAHGTAIILFSTDFSELLPLCDRVISIED